MNAKKLKETELVTKWAVQIEQKPITGKKASQNNRALINYKTGPIKWIFGTHHHTIFQSPHPSFLQQMDYNTIYQDLHYYVAGSHC